MGVVYRGNGIMEVSQTHSHVDAEEVSSARSYRRTYIYIYMCVADGHTFDTGTQQRTRSDCFPFYILTHSCCVARELVMN